MRPCSYALRLLALVCLLPSLAQANGRPPGTTGIALEPGRAAAPQTMLLGLTFGVASSNDGGKTFHWTCEEAIGGPTGVDALLAVPDANTLVTASGRGLFVSRDGGCSWTMAPLWAAPWQISALAVDPHGRGRWLVGANAPAQGRGSLWQTADGGRSYTKLALTHPGLYLYSVAVAPSAAGHIVVAGSNNGAHDSCIVLATEDGGRHWHGGPVPGAPAASATPKVAISPRSARLLLLAALDITTNGSVLLRSEDGGRTFARVGALAEPVRDITFAPDGKQVWVAGTTTILASVDGGASFAPLPKPRSNACATATAAGLYACGSSADNGDGFALAHSDNGGHSWQGMLGLMDVQGPRTCPSSDATARRCAALWANQRASIEAGLHATAADEFIATPPDAALAVQGPGVAPGGPQAAPDAPSAAVGAPAAAADGAPAPAPAPDRGQGCHCSSAGASAAPVALAALGLAWGRRRKRRG